MFGILASKECHAAAGVDGGAVFAEAKNLPPQEVRFRQAKGGGARRMICVRFLMLLAAEVLFREGGVAAVILGSGTPWKSASDNSAVRWPTESLVQ